MQITVSADLTIKRMDLDQIGIGLTQNSVAGSRIELPTSGL